MFYFQIHFMFTDDIYIVRVERSKLVAGSEDAKVEARRIIEKTVFNTGNFKIKELTLVGLVSQFHFVDDIAQLEIVKHP